MPVDLNSLTEGWLELESDPGLFTLLLEDFGVRGVQVEEVYDLQKPIEGPVFGFIFLFKWNEERRSRRKPFVTDESFVQDEEIVNSIFFAQQIVPNSCATHALLSVLLNCNKIHLGETLTRLKEYTKNMSPENKGLAIGNTPELAKAHNSHAKPEPRRLQEKSQGFTTSRTMEAFHFVSYVPIGGQLFELDGLKPYPNNHGPWGEQEDWTEKFRCVIRERLGVATGGGHDIRFNLMAVVPDRRMAYEHKLRTLKTNRQIVLEALQQLVKMTHPELTSDDHAEYMAAVMRSKQQSRTSPGGHETATASEDRAIDAPEESPMPRTAATSILASTTERCTSPSKSKTSTRASTPITSYMASHPALDSHNYAKSPLMEGISEEDPPRPRYEDCSGSDYTSEEENAGGCPSSKEVPLPPPPAVTQPIQINTKDYSHPLSIQTKFEASPTPSNSSTDTSSEVGSAFNSPVRTVAAGSAQSPTFCHGRDIKKFLVIRMTGGKDPSDESVSQGATLRSSLAPSSRTSASDASVGLDTRQNNEGATKRSLSTSKLGEEDSMHIASKRASSLSSPSSSYSDRSLRSNKDGNSPVTYGSRCLLERSESGSVTSDRVADIHKVMERSGDKKDVIKYPQLIEPHSFAPKDLLALLKNVENEILNCESNLRDEIDKRKKYKVDDCRRTHNYDRFICSFLSMLAQQGKLADLVDKHVLVKRRQGITVGRLHKKTDRRRRSRTKKRK